MYPVIDADRVAVGLYQTHAEAVTAASADTGLTAVNRDVEAYIGWYVPESGNPTEASPETDAQMRSRILAEAAEYADDLCDMVQPSWYIRTDTQNDESKARYEQTRCWIICAVAAIRGAAQASWTKAQMEGLRAAQRALMPHDPAMIRRWYAKHVTGPSPGWTGACTPITGSGDSAIVRAHFNAGPDSRITNAPVFLSDNSNPPVWDGSNGRPNVTLHRNSQPSDYRNV